MPDQYMRNTHTHTAGKQLGRVNQLAMNTETNVSNHFYFCPGRWGNMKSIEYRFPYSSGDLFTHIQNADKIQGAAILGLLHFLG